MVEWSPICLTIVFLLQTTIPSGSQKRYILEQKRKETTRKKGEKEGEKKKESRKYGKDIHLSQVTYEKHQKITQNGKRTSSAARPARIMPTSSRVVSRISQSLSVIADWENPEVPRVTRRVRQRRGVKGEECRGVEEAENPLPEIFCFDFTRMVCRSIVFSPLPSSVEGVFRVSTHWGHPPTLPT